MTKADFVAVAGIIIGIVLGAFLSLAFLVELLVRF